MKTRIIWLSISLLLILSVSLSACSPARQTTEETNSTPVTTEESIVEETEQPPASDTPDVTLTIWADPSRAEVINAAASKFETEFGVELVVSEFGYFDILTNFSVAVPAGEGPDIIVGGHDWLGELVSNGLVAPIDLGDKAANYAPSAIQAFTYNGELFGLPFATENVALFRNTDLVPDSLSTWEDVVAISRQLTAQNGETIADNKYGFVLAGNDAYHFFPLMTAFGGYVFGQKADGSYDPTDIGIGSEGSIEGAILFDEMLEDKLIPPDLDGQTIVDWFEQGKAAMIITGPWNLERIKGSEVKYAIDPLPSGSAEGRPFLGSMGFMINSFSENPLIAQIFVTEFLGTVELMQAFYDADPRAPAYLEVLDNIADTDIEAFAFAGKNAMPMPSIPEMGSVWQAWINALLLVAQQTEEPDTAFPTAAKQIAASISGEPIEEEPVVEEEGGEIVAYKMVNIPGTAQKAIGCAGDWQPDCEITALTEGENGVWSGEFDIPAGTYEVKIACNGGWDINFGVDGNPNGANFKFTVASDARVTFTFDTKTNLLEITGEGVEVTKGASLGG